MMLNFNRYLYLATCFILLQITGSYCKHGGKNAHEIDTFIYSLGYNKDEAVSYKGENIENHATEGYVDKYNRFIVLTKEKKTIENSYSDISILSSNKHKIFPGALLVANSHLINNDPDVIPIDRSNLTYVVNLPGMRLKEGSYNIIPNLSNYKENLYNVLNNWFDKYYRNRDFEPKVQIDSIFYYSPEQLKVKFGIDFEFDFGGNDSKLIMIFRIRQTYYTVNAELPYKPSDIFGEGTSVQDLRYKIDDKNPPVMVDRCGYGYEAFVVITTSSIDAKEDLKNKLMKLNIDVNSERELMSRLKDLNIKVYLTDGRTRNLDYVSASTFREAYSIVVKHAKFDHNNFGNPITYRNVFLKDNSEVVAHSSAEYMETIKHVYKGGKITLVHNGAFVNQYSVSWDEVSYDKNGKMLVKRVQWGKNWKDFLSPSVEVIQLAGNCRNINVLARACTLLAWEWWKVIFDRKGMSLIDERTIKIWGTAFAPNYSFEPALLTITYVGGSEGTDGPDNDSTTYFMGRKMTF